MIKNERTSRIRNNAYAFITSCIESECDPREFIDFDAESRIEFADEFETTTRAIDRAINTMIALNSRIE